jgi:mono/diheme cytochrome c family protein
LIDAGRAWRSAAAALATLGTLAAAPFARVAVGLEPAAPAAALIERGEYLTQNVAMCVQCHTPRNADGDLDRTQLFRGAAIPLASPFRRREWATKAPAIAGLLGFTDEEAITLLMTGHRPTGEVPRPPMPPFRMTREDAAAVVAYLKSLPAIQ